MGKISRDLPLSEIVLRRYEKPQLNVGERELVKKLCLSVGLLQPGDSRDVVVDLLYVMLKNRKREMKCPEIEKRVIASRKKHRQPMVGIAGSNVRRQLKRLRELFLVEKVKNKYRLAEFSKPGEIFEQKVEKFLLENTLSRVKEYFAKVDETFFR